MAHTHGSPGSKPGLAPTPLRATCFDCAPREHDIGADTSALNAGVRQWLPGSLQNFASESSILSTPATPTTRMCATCRRELPVVDFGRKGTGWQYSCRGCIRTYSATHYANNRLRYIKTAKKNTTKKRSEIANVKRRPCADCKQKFPAVCMDFDHREGEEKEFILARGPFKAASKVSAEMAKCDVVCANCHRIRTYRRRHGDAPT